MIPPNFPLFTTLVSNRHYFCPTFPFPKSTTNWFPHTSSHGPLLFKPHLSSRGLLFRNASKTRGCVQRGILFSVNIHPISLFPAKRDAPSFPEKEQFEPLTENPSYPNVKEFRRTSIFRNGSSRLERVLTYFWWLRGIFGLFYFWVCWNKKN